MYKIALITENTKEFGDYVNILNAISIKCNIKVYIVSLSDIYIDSKQKELIKLINFEYNILTIENIYNKPFKEYSILEKIKLVWKIQNKIFLFIIECSLLLSGIQTIFQRVLYNKIKNNNNIDIKTIVYHRHLLFDDSVNTSSSSIIHNSFVYKILSLVNLDGFLIEKKAVGFADLYMVLGNINKTYLESKNIDTSHIHTVGSLEYDNIEEYMDCNKKENNLVSICYITSACEWIGDKEGELYQKNKINNFLNYCKDNNLDDITIRIHPRENFNKYEELKQEFKYLKLQYPSNNKLLEDLKEFDIIIGGFSTVLFEAMLINKQVVFYSLKDEEYRYNR